MSETLSKLVNTKGYENLKEILGNELGSLIYQAVEESKKDKEKVKKWDELSDKIEKCYVDENGDELPEDDSENIDLCTIGEISAAAFGWL